MQTFLHVRRFTMAQRLLLTVGVRPTIENVTRRQIKTLCSAVYGRQSSHNPLVPHHVRCNVPATAVQSHLYSSSAPKQSSIQRIKVVLKEYGGVAVVFHTVMSLASLGTCYLVVDSGVDVGKVLEYFNVQSSSTTKGASTFAVAYVLHKMFLPLRAGITVASVPLIVRWLRTRGWVKGVVKVQPK